MIWNHWGQDAYWELIRIRFLSNALAALIVVPLIVTWATNGILRLRTARLSQLPGGMRSLLVGLFSVSYAVLYKFGPGADSALLFLTSAVPSLGSGTIRLPGDKHVLFRLSASWRFGAQPTGMGRSPAEQLNKTRFQSKYF
mgnify:CR=1 FL=1